MSDTPVAEIPGDLLREGLLERFRAELGAGLVESHLVPGVELWLRVATESWRATALAARKHGFDYFCFLSAIDWMPSPYGKGEDDPTAPPPERDDTIRQGYAGGATRFQLLARLYNVRERVGVMLKTDVGDDLVVESWVPAYAGANWHERETHEMFGISFAGHPDLRNLYLPVDFEGFPLRKDFPLLARIVKPWPGIVDVEPMPGTDDEGGDEA